jgi:hypothetical protein
MKYLLALSFLLAPVVQAQQPAFHVLAFYSETVEHDHVDFAHQAIKYYAAAAQRDHFDFASTTNWDDLNVVNLARYELILWLDDQPHTPQQRASFEEYMVDGWAFTSLPTTIVIRNGHGSLVFLAVVFFTVTTGRRYRQPLLSTTSHTRLPCASLGLFCHRPTNGIYGSRRHA